MTSKRAAPRRRTEEEKRQYLAAQAEAAKPKTVVDHGVVIRDVDTAVAPGDPNAKHRGGETRVSVRRAPSMEPPLPPMRPGEVRINMAAAESQWWLHQHDRAAERQHRRRLDPFDYGHWGPSDE
ncbi:hypothetical protein [uncultured Bradyrhizobium sp.]|jgi:hypothetical protein|uniref:hypothetical protein n=1 Tax=uncultured Bradyrhizobium sp. TaxID=199684 RepID=UPI0026255B10|nr:hypothetical protein [uncultured Bradyrhizobium sp.]